MTLDRLVELCRQVPRGAVFLTEDEWLARYVDVALMCPDEIPYTCPEHASAGMVNYLVLGVPVVLT